MESLKRTQSAQGYVQEVESPDTERAVDPLIGNSLIRAVNLGSEKFNIPPPRVSSTPLEIHSIEVAAVSLVAVPPDSTINSPVSWLEFTPENTANLTENEIAQLLRFGDEFDPSKFGTMLLLPNGIQIVFQIIELISEDRLLELIGGNETSADSFTYILFEDRYFPQGIGERPPERSIRYSIEVECKPLPQGFPEERAEELITAPAQAMMELYVDEGKRREFESQLRNVVNLIAGKFPPPNEENQVYWDNICEAIKVVIGKSRNTDSQEGLAEFEERLAGFKERFPAWSLAFFESKGE
ncbi:MAG: hypothetical protein LBD34_01815 [Puniceicoccales bacterium]|jgi:hypothetical protein|nr:hypothetical protein [Puniceicoccales bacterium]